MEEFILFINDIDTNPTLVKELNMITLDPAHHKLLITYAWVGPNGIGDQETREEPIDIMSLSELHDYLNDSFDHILTIEDMLLNERLITYYISLENQSFIKEIDDLYCELLWRLWRKKDRNEEENVDLAITYQEYGHFLEKVDLSRSIDPYLREKTILEEVAINNPNEDNKRNVLVGLEDVIRVYEKLGDDFEKEALNYTLALFKQYEDCHLENNYEKAHIAEKIGLHYASIDTIEDLDNIDSDDQRIKLSLYYHNIEKDIFKMLLDEDPSLDNKYNYGISLRQMGNRYEQLGDQDSLKQASLLYDEAYELFSELYKKDPNYRESYIIASEQKGNIAFLREKYKDALYYYEEVYQLEKEDALSNSDDDLFSVAIILKKLGKVNEKLHNIDQALAYYKESLSLNLDIEKRTDIYVRKAEVGIAYMNIGWVYMNKSEYNLAKEYFEKDLAIREKLHDEYQSVSSHYSLSLAYRHMGYVLEELDEKQSLDYFRKCFDISAYYEKKYSHEGERHYLAVSTHDLAYDLMRLGYLEEAKSYYEKVLYYLEHYKEKRKHEYVLNKEEISDEYHQLMALLKGKEKEK